MWIFWPPPLLWAMKSLASDLGVSGLQLAPVIRRQTNSLARLGSKTSIRPPPLTSVFQMLNKYVELLEPREQREP